MGRRKGSNVLIAIVLLIMIAWPLYQIYDMIGDKRVKHDPIRLLYQVSLLQMELLNGFLNEAGQATDTLQLNSLKQAVYSVNYTHERLVLAVGEDQLYPLRSIPQLMQFIIRLQMIGVRTLKPEELATLQEVSVAFGHLYEAYGVLMSSKAKIVSSQNVKINQIDEQIAANIRERLLK